MTGDYTWTIDGIEAEALQQRQTPTIQRGRSLTLTFGFEEQTEEQTSSTEERSPASYGSASYPFTYGGSTLTTTSTSTTVTRSFADTYGNVLDFLTYQGDVAVRRGTTDRGEPWFRERLPDSAPVDTLLVDVEPGADVIDAPGFWALLIDGTDQSQPPARRRVVELELFVLAELSEYATKSDVRSAFGDELTV